MQLEFGPEMSVHIREIDAQHKKFIETINKLDNAIYNQKAQIELEKYL